MTRAPAVIAVLAWGLGAALPAGAQSSLCDTRARTPASAPYLAIFSAFPAELVPLLAATDVETTREIDGRLFYVGRMGGVNVVLSLTGIGMINARQSAERLLANFDVAGIVFSGVAGSEHRIGDVVVARTWVEEGSSTVWKVNEAMRALAKRVVKRLPEPFETCATVPPTDPNGEVICMPKAPRLVFEKRGQSGDPFNGNALACIPDGGEVLGCEIPEALAAAVSAPVRTDVVDQETAAVCRVAVERSVPFVGVRGVSDGAGDPQGPREFPAQFFDYYRLAAVNAAIVTRGIVTELGAFAADPGAEKLCGRLAQQKWRSAAKLIRSAP